jgi:hypothetical protein
MRVSTPPTRNTKSSMMTESPMETTSGETMWARE